MADLHPDIVRAIRGLADTKLGRRYDRFARRRYGVRGTILAGKEVSGEFGGRSTRAGRGVVSSAGARGPAQFIASTRQYMIDKYGVDPWAGDKQAIRAMELYQLENKRGVEGYNPGMPTYRNYILGQKLNRPDRRALKKGGASASASPGRTGAGALTLQGPQRTRVGLQRYTVPGQSFAAERDAAKEQLLLGGGPLTMDKLLEYKQTINGLQDVPPRRVSGGITVRRSSGKPVTVPTRAPRRGNRAERATANVGGGIYEVFYDPLRHYWDSGGVHKGAIGGHDDHVHVSADTHLVERLGRVAQHLGLNVSGERKYDGTPTSGHVNGSFHYKNEAIDVSGDPAAMHKFARMVIAEARRGRGK